MKKAIFLLALMACVYAGWSQSGELVKINGTKYSMVPPKGFIQATRFRGFQQEETNTSIMLADLPVDYAKMKAEFTADAFLQKGMSLQSKEEVTVQGQQATLYQLKQTQDGITVLKQLLLIGNNKQTTMINGIYLETNNAIAPAIRTSLLSLSYDTAVVADPVAASAFSIDVSNTDFHFLKDLSGTLLYSTDNKIPSTKPMIVVGPSVAQIIPPGNQKKYTEERIKKFPNGETVVIKESNPITIDGLNGYELIADGKTKDGSKEVIYLMMLYMAEGGYYIFTGRAREDFDTNLATFKQIGRTFKRKKA